MTASVSRQGDVCNRKLVKHIFGAEKVDLVFHLAAKTHVGEPLCRRHRRSVLRVLQF